MDDYPATLSVDCSFLSPNMAVKIGDIEKMLPHGMYLHKMYNNMKFHSFFKLIPTNQYTNRQNMIVEQQDQINNQKRKMQSALLERKSSIESGKKNEKSVPKMKATSKTIAQSRKDISVTLGDGTVISIDEAIARGKAGERGKGGKAV